MLHVYDVVVDVVGVVIVMSMNGAITKRSEKGGMSCK